MTITEYLIELEEELKFLPKGKKESTLIVYREKINNMLDYGEDENKIVESLPKPKEIAENLYLAEGINYLDKRQKQVKQKDNFKAVVSALIIVLLVSSVFVILWFSISSVVKIFGLLFSLKGVLEITISLFLVLSYVLVLFLVTIYIVDLLHMIFNMLLENVLRPFNKNPKFLDNSVMDYIDKLTKKPKLLGKILGVAFVVLVLFLGIGYFTKTYFYRSISSIKSDEYVEVIDLTEYLNEHKFKIDVDAANVIISKGDKFQMTVSSEFNRNNNIQVVNNVVSYTTDSIKEFDVFGLFSEPTPYIELTIPHNVELEIKVLTGMIQLDKMILNTLNANLESGNIIIYDSNIDNVNIYTSRGGINLTNCSFVKASIESRAGTAMLENVNGNELSYINGAANVDMKKLVFNKFNVNTETGHVFINNLHATNLIIDAQSSTIDLKKINTQNFINIKSTLESSITLYESKTNQLNVLTNGGTFTGYYLDMNGSVETTGSVMLSYIQGNFDVKALGRYLDIHEYIGETLNVQTQSSEATLKFIKANTIKYNANSSTTIMNLVFGKDMVVRDGRGDIVFDNNKDICKDDELALYDKYYQKIERLDITPSANFNVNGDVKLGAWE